MSTKKWVSQQEKILKKWSEECMGLSYMHDRSFKKFQRLHINFSLPVIVLSTIAGTANFATQSFPEEYRPYVSLVTGAINLIAGTITTVQQFLKIPENLESHRASSNDFGKLARTIRIELSLPLKERSMTGREFINQCRNEMENLLERAPDISLGLVKTFTGKFKNKEFHMPDIVDLNKVDIFIDDDIDYNKKVENAAKELIEMKEKTQLQVSHVGANLESFMSVYKNNNEENEEDEKIEE